MFASKDLMFAKQGGGYQISRSVRLRSSASAYFNRTLTTPTNNKIWTWSGWVKRSTPGASQGGGFFESPSSGSTFASLVFYYSDTITLYEASAGATVYYLQTTQVFRDPSAWYHIVVAYDNTQATSTNRIKLYVNGVQVTSFSSAAYPTQNTTSRINSAVSHKIGTFDAAPSYFDGYITEINFVDGQALTPTSFGAFDAVTGVWNPIRYSGTYGTNGFYLNFSDNSSNTATTIGKDYSGNGNNWTPNNISVTAGTTYDSMVDVPIGYGSDTGAGGEVRGNYCVLNPLRVGSQSSLASGNLDFTSTSSGGSVQNSQITSTFGIPSSGKWYFECTPTTIGASIYIGVVNDTLSMGTSPFSGSPIRTYRSSTGYKSNGGTDSAYGNTYTTNDVIGVAIDMDSGSIYFYKNGTVQNSGTAAFTDLSGTTWVPYCAAGSSGTTNNGNFNFGQRAFAYTAPSGYKALCTQNLPTPTILNGANYMAASIWNGSGGSQTVANTVNGISFQPDMVWIKSRSTATDHQVFDVVRGGNPPKRLLTDSTGAESSTATGYVGTTSTGIELDGSGGGGGDTNVSGRTYVGWQWKANGAGVSNTSGSITSTVSASATAGCSVLTYTGTGATATVGHGLGVAPSMIIVKKRSNAGAWKVYHTILGNTKILELNATDAAQTSSTYWNNTSPTSTLITVGSNGDINASSETYVAYCWSQITGYSAFTTYTGNGSGDGPFVYCGFRPRWLMIKRYDAAGDPWWLIDSSRSPYNQTTLALRPNAINAEDNGGNANFDFLSNGFKARTSGGGNGNESGATYIVAAFAENPFTLSRAR